VLALVRLEPQLRRAAEAQANATAQRRLRSSSASTTDGYHCDDLFGVEGFAQWANVIAPPRSSAHSGSSGAFLRCSRHRLTQGVLCEAAQLVLNASRIVMDAGGGEPVEVVAALKRTSAAERPVFQRGAFAIAGGDGSEGPALDARWSISELDRYRGDALRSLAAAAPSVAASGCDPGSPLLVVAPVIMLTRVEYANLYHQTTDLFNAWLAAQALGLAPGSAYAVPIPRLTPQSRVADASRPGCSQEQGPCPPPPPKVPAHIVFIDAHASTAVDGAWTALFLSTSHVKHFPPGTCFARAAWAPFGYRSALSTGLGSRLDCAPARAVAQFGEDVVRGLGLTPALASDTCRRMGGRRPAVLLVSRRDYKAHARHAGRIVRRLDNEAEIAAALAADATAGSAPEDRYALLDGDLLVLRPRH